jgi:antitoxin HicB
MTANELKRRLEKAGCRVEEGTKHWIVYYQCNRTTIPRHPGKEIKNGHVLQHLKAIGDKTKVSIHMEYPARFEPAKEGGFIVTIPDFGWGVTQGDTEDEAREMATALLQTLVQEHIRNGRDLPHPSKPHSRKFRRIRLPALQAAKVELYREWVAAGIRKAELARRLGIPKTSVERLFDLHHHSRLDHIEAAFKALGKEISIDVRDAA